MFGLFFSFFSHPLSIFQLIFQTWADTQGLKMQKKKIFFKKASAFGWLKFHFALIYFNVTVLCRRMKDRLDEVQTTAEVTWWMELVERTTTCHSPPGCGGKAGSSLIGGGEGGGVGGCQRGRVACDWPRNRGSLNER